jgi:murein DD-endopeptidase MepM/ murein hydrolase activator NlpD
VANSFDSLHKAIDDLINKVNKLEARATGGTSGGTSGGSVMGGALAEFTPPSKAVLGMNLAGAAIQTIGGVAASASSMMPNTLSVVSREAGIYSAGVSMGGMVNRNILESSVRMGLGGRQMIDNATGRVAQMLVGQGVGPTSAKFAELTRAAGGAVRAFNMAEDRSVPAMEALSAGPMAANLLQSYGIFTANPITGQEFSQKQIFDQLSDRFTQGNLSNMSTEELMTDIRRGALGSNIRNSGLDATQQELLINTMIAKTQGIDLDLSDAKSVGQYEAMLKQQGYDNPLEDFQKLTAKDDELAETATQPYLEGIKDATGALMDLKDVVQDQLIPVLGRFKATLDTFMGDSAGAGVVGMGGSVLSGVTSGATAVMGYSAMKSLATKGGGAAAPTTAGAVRSGYSAAATGGKAMTATAGKQGLGGSMAFKGATKAVPGLSAAFAGIDAFGNAQQGGSFDWGGTLLNTAMAAGVGFLTAGPAGAAIAGAATLGGAVVGHHMGGGGSVLGNGEGGGSDGQGEGTMGPAGTQTESFWLAHPTKSAKIGARHGATHSVYSGKLIWPDGHKGIDYEGVKGDLIHASAPGKVTVENGGELGLRVKLQHNNGMYTFYCHLSAVDVKDGQQVERGHVVGRMGNTGGKSTGVHLHFALSKTNTTAGHTDPEPYLRGGANYMEPAPADQSQSAAGNSPSPSGNSVTTSALGGEDSSAATAVVGASGLSGTAADISISAPGGGGAGTPDLPPPHSGESYSGTSTTTAPEGGEDTVYSSDYMPVKSYNRGKRSRSSSGGGATNNVTINLSIAQASDEEARRFALLVKEQLEDEKFVMRMGNN